MEQIKIEMLQNWVKFNPERDTHDQWYINFAERIYTDILHDSKLLSAPEMQKLIATSLSTYFKDVIGERGGWNAFKQRYRKLYKRELPIFSTGDEYVKDEINREDIALILWMSCCIVADNMPVIDPKEKEITKFSKEIYKLMDEEFEEAPIIERDSHLSWFAPVAYLEIKRTPLPSAVPNKKTPADAQLAIEYSKGKPIFISSFEEFKELTTQKLKWEHSDEMLQEMSKHQNFIIYPNSKGILLAMDVAQYFKSSDNPLYDKEQTKAEGYRLFCKPGLCPFDLLKCGEENKMFDDMELPFRGGKKLFKENRDFFARTHLLDYYEGK